MNPRPASTSALLGDLEDSAYREDEAGHREEGHQELDGAPQSIALLDHGARVFAVEEHVDPVANLHLAVEARDRQGAPVLRVDEYDVDSVLTESSGSVTGSDHVGHTVRPASGQSLLRDEGADGHGATDHQGEQCDDETAPRSQLPLHGETVTGLGTRLGHLTGTQRGSVPQTGEGQEAENGG